MDCEVSIPRLNEKHAQMDCGALVSKLSTVLSNLRYLVRVFCVDLVSCVSVFG